MKTRPSNLSINNAARPSTMKRTRSNPSPRRAALILAGSVAALLAAPSAKAAIYYWDGATPAGAPGGGAGTWNHSLSGNTANWDTSLAGADTAWVNANLDTAVFGGTAGAVALGASIDVGGLTFNTTGYGITTTGFTLNFADTVNPNIILFNNIAAATITGPVGGTGNVILSTSNPATAGTLTLNGTSTVGWSGTTTINAGMTLSLSGLNQGLVSTTGITLNGGGITLTSADTTAEDDLDRVSNSAAITSNGGTITYTTTTAASVKVFAETIGSVDLVRGQTNFFNTLDKSAGSQTLALSGLTRTGASNTSAVTFANAGGLNITTDRIRVNGVTTDTTAGQIIGPWATYGTSVSNQTDYAVYDSDGTNGYIVNASISATAENTWTTAANNYTLNSAATLTGTRTVNTLRYTGGALALDLGASNFNLQTNGLLNGGSGTLTISTNGSGLTGTGGLTTPTGGGNLYLTSGAAGITVSAPIIDNGGAVTVVQSGSSTLTLSSIKNNFSGGIVLNAGTLAITQDANLGSGGGITVNGTASINGNDQYSLNRTLTLNEGGFLSLGNGFGVTGVFSGNGALNVTSADDFNFTNAANTFTGAITSATSANTGYGLTFASIGDTAGAGLINLVGGSGTFRWTSASGSTTTLANRQFAISSAGSGMISALGTAGSSLVINKDLLITGAAGARTLTLNGTNTGLNTFAGNIANGTNGGTSVVSLIKQGAGIWALSGTNTYSGPTESGRGTHGTLIFQGAQALSDNTTLQYVNSGGVGSSVVFRILHDTATTVTKTTGLLMQTTDSSSGLVLFVGNNGTANGGNGAGGTTGGTIALGNYNVTDPNNANVNNTLHVTGANGYRLLINNVTTNLNAAGGINTPTFNPTTAPLTIAGTVQQAAGSAGTTTLNLDGTAFGIAADNYATGNLVSGNILNSLDGTPKLLSLTKTSSSTWTLSGTNGYDGTTSVSGGLLRFTGDSSGATGNVTVSGGSLGGTGSLGGAVSLTTAGGINLLNSAATDTLTLGSTLNIGGGVGANNLFFDLASAGATVDKIAVTGAFTMGTSGAGVINLNQLGGTANRLTAGTYDLITAGSGMTAGGTNFTLATTAAFGQTFSLASSTTTALKLTNTHVTSATAAAFWAGGGNNWSTTTNWRSTVAGGGAVAGAPDYQTNVTFATTTPVAANLATNVLDVDFDINSLTFNSGLTAITIGGPTRTLTIEATNANGNTAGVGITSTQTTVTNTISAKVGLAASQTWSVAGTTAALGGLTVSGVISDFGLGNGLTKAGNGTLTLSAAPTYTGATTISGGTLNFSSAPTSFNTSSIIFSGNSTLQTGGPANQALPNMTVNSGITATFDGGSAGSNSAYTMSTLTSGSSTSKFKVTSNGGSGRGITFGSLAGFTGTLEYDLGASGGFYLSTPDLTDTASTFIRMKTANTSATILNFIYTGVSDLTLNNRQFELFSTTAATTHGITNNGTGTFTINPNLLVSATGTKILALGGTGPSVFGGTINDGTGAVVSLSKIGTGTWTLTNTDGYTGSTTITAGTLRLGGGGTTGSLTGTASITNNANLTINRSNPFTQLTDLNNKAITGTGSLTQLGSGGVTLSLANTFSGATTITPGAGTLTLTHNQALQNSALTFSSSDALILSGTTTPTIGGINSTTNLASVSGYSSVTTLTLNPQTGVTATYGGNLSNGSGAMNLIKSGAGTQILSGAVTYTGTTTVNAGVLQISQGSLSGGTITLGADGATLLFANGQGSAGVSGLGGGIISNAIVLGNSVTTTGAKLFASGNQGRWNFTGGITGAAGAAGAQTLLFDTRGGGTVGGDRTTTTISGVIANGNQALNLNFAITPQSAAAANAHPAYVNLTGLNTFTGSITATRGAAGNSSWLVIGGERWSDGPSNTPSYGRMGSGRLGDNASGVYAGAINFGSTAGNVVNLDYFSSANQTWSGVIGAGANNNGALVKEGTGTLTLTNANLYNSVTTIGGGTLKLGFDTTTTNILPSTTPLHMGLGSIYDPITANADMTISGGGGGGTLEFAGASTAATYAQTVASLTVNANTTNRILHSVTAGAGTQTLTVTSSTLTIGANSGLNFDLVAGGANGATIGTGRVVLTGNTSVAALNSGWTVSDAGGFGLAGTNASNQVIRNTGTTLLPATGATSATDYRVDNNAGGAAADGSSSLVVTASESAKSITVDTTTASGILTLNSGVVLSNNIWNFGAASGTNNYEITGSAGGAGVRPVASTNTVSINNFNAGSVTFTSPILANGATNALVVGGTGTVTLSGVNTFIGSGTVGITINSGNLQIGGAGSLTSGTYAGIISINGGSTLQYSSSAAQTLSGVISGPGGITKDTSSSSTLTLTGVNNYTGATTVSAGTLAVTLNNALGSGAEGTIVTGGGTLQLTNVNYSTTEGLTINGAGVGGTAGALASSGSSSFAGAISAATSAVINAVSGTLALTGGIVKDGTTLTFKGGGIIVISGTGISGVSANSDLVVDGATVTETVANTYNGPTTITNGGVLNANVTNALPFTPRSVVSFSGTGAPRLNLGASQVAASLASSTASAVVNLSATGTNTLTVGTTSGSTDFTGSITGTGGSLIKDNTSTQILSGTNGYTGTTTVSGGTLEVTGTLSGTTGVTVNTGGTMLLNNTATPAITTTPAVNLDGGTLAFGNAVTAQTQSLGTLTLTVNSTLDFGSGGGDKFLFAGFSHTGGTSLAINNWTSTLGGAGGTGVDGTDDRLVFLGLYTDFTSSFSQSQISFNGSNGYAAIDIGGLGTSYEIVPVPEPATTALIGAVALCALIGYRERRRFIGVRSRLASK